MYDAIVVGARCAGAPTAMLLGRKGHEVLLVDRSTFPSDLRQSTLLIHQPGVSYLEQWGLLGKVRASGAPPITRWLVDLGPLVFKGSPLADGKTTEGIAPRRTVLDKILLRWRRRRQGGRPGGFYGRGNSHRGRTGDRHSGQGS